MQVSPTNNDDSRDVFNYLLIINISTPSSNDGTKSAWGIKYDSSGVVSWCIHCSKPCCCKDISHCGWMSQQWFRAGLGRNSRRPNCTVIYYGNPRPHAEPHIDTNATIDVVLLSANSPDIDIQCLYNALNFLTNIHERHPIAHPLGRGMGCLL